MVSKRLSREVGHRRKFLAVIDDTPECERAVHYAAARSKSTNGMLVLIFVIEPGDFQHWLGVEEIMKAEAREGAEVALEKFAAQVRETIGIEPEMKIRTGTTEDEIHAEIEEDQDIAILVLASGSAKDGPGLWFRRLREEGLHSQFRLPSSRMHLVMPILMRFAEAGRLC